MNEKKKKKKKKNDVHIVFFTEWTPQAVFSRVAVATSENTDCGVHDWNKIQSYTEKIKFLFLLCFYLQ